MTGSSAGIQIQETLKQRVSLKSGSLAMSRFDTSLGLLTTKFIILIKVSWLVQSYFKARWLVAAVYRY